MSSIADSFYATFIEEGRYQFFLDGLWMTLLLTLSAFVLGTILGALFCAMRMSKIKWLSKLASAINALLVQLPTMVMLMVFVYVLFVSLPISVVIVVIFGLTLKAAAYLCDIFYTAVTAVDSGECEAARTLGMTKVQAFMNVALPQAIQQALPLYQNQLVITLQETAIVGTLAVQDLTRASSIVTSRTLDAFFGLLVISIIYLALGFLLGRLIQLILGRKKHLGEAVE